MGYKKHPELKFDLVGLNVAKTLKGWSIGFDILRADIMIFGLYILIVCTRLMFLSPLVMEFDLTPIEFIFCDPASLKKKKH